MVVIICAQIKYHRVGWLKYRKTAESGDPIPQCNTVTLPSRAVGVIYRLSYALLGQWIDWDTTDVLMRVRILHGVQKNFLAILPESFSIQQHRGTSTQSRINGRRGLLTRVCSLW